MCRFVMKYACEVMPTSANMGSCGPMMATLANVGPTFGGVRPVVQHWPTLPPPFTTLGRTLAKNSQCWSMLDPVFGYKSEKGPWKPLCRSDHNKQPSKVESDAPRRNKNSTTVVPSYLFERAYLWTTMTKHTFLTQFHWLAFVSIAATLDTSCSLCRNATHLMFNGFVRLSPDV